MNGQGWTVEWQAFHAAEADFQAAVEQFRRTGGDRPSQASLLRAVDRRDRALAELERHLRHE